MLQSRAGFFGTLQTAASYRIHSQSEHNEAGSVYLGAMALECLERVAVKSLAVHLSSTAVVLLLSVISRAAVLVEE